LSSSEYKTPEDWKEAKRVAGAESLRHEYFYTERTEPVIWAWYVYLAAQRMRPWIEERRLDALERFRDVLKRDEARKTSLGMAALFSKRGGFRSFNTAAKAALMVRQWGGVELPEAFQAAENIVKDFVWECLADSEFAFVVVLQEFYMIATEIPLSTLTRESESTYQLLGQVSGVSPEDWRAVVKERSLSQNAFLKRAKRVDSAYYLKRERTLLRYAEAWVDHNIPPVEGGETETLEEIGGPSNTDRSNLSTSLKVIDAAMAKERDPKGGAPLGKPHRVPAVVGYKKIE